MGKTTTGSLNASTFPVSALAQAGVLEEAAFAVGKEDQRANQWNQIFEELAAMRRLQDDWDGLGARAPSAALIQSAIELAATLRSLGSEPASSVMAGPTGTILFNWQNDYSYLDAEITKPYVAEWMLVIPGQPTKHGVIAHFDPGHVTWTPGVSPEPIRPWVPDQWIDARISTMLSTA